MDSIISRFKINSLKKRGALLIASTIVSNFFNLIFNAYLGRVIKIEDFAVVALISSIYSISGIPIGALGSSVTFKSAYLLGKYQKPAYNFWRSTRKRAIAIALFLTVLWLASISLLVNFFNLSSITPILAFSPVWFVSIISSVDGGYLNGNLKFGYLGVALALEAISKFLIAIILIKIGLGEYTYLAIILSLLVSFIIISFSTNKIDTSKVKQAKKISFPTKFYLSSFMSRVSTVVYLSADVILAKHFLSPQNAGEYALLSLAGKMVFFAGSLFNQFILPITSHKEGSGKKTFTSFYKLLGITTASSLIVYFVVGFFGPQTMPLIFGEKAAKIASFLSLYSLSMVAFTVSTSIVTFNQTLNKHATAIASFVIAIIQIIAIVIFGNSIASISRVVSAAGFLSVGLILIVHLFSNFFETIISNIRDFLDAFTPAKKGKAKGLRILIFNWRDTKHMWAGGAEVYIHELSRRWVKDGNSVTIFCGNDHKNVRNETIDGVSIIRRGGFFTVYIWAFLYYILKFRNNYDLIIDSENGIPFFTPLYSTKPVILLIHHVHQDIFVTQMKPPLSYLGKFIEGTLMPVIYRRNTIVTVSKSSRDEIVKARIASVGRIHIISPGIEIPSKFFKKDPNPTLIYLGRLKAYKNIDLAIKAFSKVIKRNPFAQFWIVGEGELLQPLKNLVSELKLEKKVVFYGKVSEKQKIELLSKSWISIQPSQVEGWGITVIEANSCKTPVIASRTYGLIDSVLDGETGKLVRVGHIAGFAETINFLFKNKRERQMLSKRAFAWSKNFSWEKSSNSFFELANYEITKSSGSYALRGVTNFFNRLTSIF